jgi:CDP-4-dehydro-6-deoxyglucose reductase, E1
MNWSEKRVFVTGHTGFKGEWLMLDLAARGARIVSAALKPAMNPNLFTAARIESVGESRIVDIRNIDFVLQVVRETKPEIVFHLAVQPLVRRSYAQPIETFQINVMGTANVLEAVRRVGSARVIVVVTTDKCYENREWWWGYDEIDPLDGRDPYSASKAVAELVAGAYRSSYSPPGDFEKHGIALAAARAGIVIGGGDWSEDRLIPEMVRAFTCGSPVVLRNPQAVCQWQHVLEPIEGYIGLAEKLWDEPAGFASGWNFGPELSDAIPVGEIVKLFAACWGNRARWELDSTAQSHEAGLLRQDCSKATAELGWTPLLHIQDAVRMTADWYHHFLNGSDDAPYKRSGRLVPRTPRICREGTAMTMTDPQQELRNRIAALVAEYHGLAFAPNPFVPGETPVPVFGRVFGAEEMQYLVDSSLEFWLTTGRYAAQFDRESSRFAGARDARLTNSGSSANLNAISALTSPSLSDRRLQPGAEVITLVAGFPTTVNPVIQNRLVSVFVDVVLPTYDVDVTQLDEALSDRTRAIFMAHTLGNPFNLEVVADFAERQDLWLIEDCCDALGSTYKGRAVGTFGDLATVSFYPAHHITSGEGGCVLTQRPALTKLVESFREWGRDCWCYPGCNNTCGKRFEWQLGTLPDGYDHKYTYILPQATENSDPSWFGFPIAVRPESGLTRTGVTRQLESRKIGTRLLFAGNLTRQPAYEDGQFRVVGDLKVTEYAMNSTFWVGTYPGLTEAKVDYIAQSPREVASSRKQNLVTVS